MTPMLSMVMNLLKSRNPQMFNGVNQAIQSGMNPQGFMKQVMGNLNPEQKAQVIKQAGDMGCPQEILKQVQNMK